MLERLILDVDKALDAEAYLAALSLMLTLPDICAKAKYGDSLGNKSVILNGIMNISDSMKNLHKKKTILLCLT